MNNFQLMMEKIISEHKAKGETPAILLHSCCAPCSSYVIEYLSQFFKITVFYYNPNITERDEYLRRAEEQKRFISEFSPTNVVNYIEGIHDTENFLKLSAGLEDLPEGFERCFRCYKLRLMETAEAAKNNGFDYFTTTLSISPHKNAEKINGIGLETSKIYGVKYLVSDFKKKNGFKRSCDLAAEYNLYRQDYCGCIYSKIQAEKRKFQKTVEKRS